MTDQSEQSTALLRREPAAETFLRPLDFLAEEHARQLQVREWLFPDGAALRLEDVAAQAADLLHYLAVDLARHHADEEEDLFPLLLKRALPDDGIERVLARLAREHTLDDDLISFVCADLERLATGLTLANAMRFAMNLSELFDSQRRHLERENDLVLPLARQRLGAEDLSRLGRSMAARRGLAL